MLERLQKTIAHAGIASRRKAEELIVRGEVTVNGRVVRELGAKVDPSRDHIKVAGKLIRPERLQSFAVYKPQGMLCSVSDAQGRRVVTDLVQSGKRLYPAGRLDYQSEGLVIVTNDGELAQAVTRAGTHAKVYRVKVRGTPSAAQIDRLAAGVRLEDEQLAPCGIRVLKRANNSWYEVRLNQGKNRQIRRMFDSIGHGVMRLRRVSIGPVSLAGLKPGGSRPLTPREVSQLKEEGR